MPLFMAISYGCHWKLICRVCSKRIIRSLERSSNNAQGLCVVGDGAEGDSKYLEQVGNSLKVPV